LPHYRVFTTSLARDSNQEPLDLQIKDLMSAMMYSKKIDGYKIEDNVHVTPKLKELIMEPDWKKGKNYAIRNPFWSYALRHRVEKVRTYTSDHLIGEVIHFKKDGKNDITPDIKYFYGPSVLSVGILQPSRKPTESDYYIYRVLEKR
jgi:hypothetical protein